MNLFRGMTLMIMLLVASEHVAQDYWNTTCGPGDPVLTSIMINACCNEWTNEYFVFQTGSSPFTVSSATLSLEVQHPGNGTYMNPVNVWSSNTSVLDDLNGLMSTCIGDTVFRDGLSGPIPANSVVWVFLSPSPEIIGCYLDLSQFCGAEDIYVVFGNYSGLTPVFQNGVGPACIPGPCYRPIEVVIGSCQHNLSYDASVFTTPPLPSSGVDGDNISPGMNGTVSYNNSTGADCAPEAIFCTDPPPPVLGDDSLSRCTADMGFPMTSCGGCNAETEWVNNLGELVSSGSGSFPPSVDFFPSSGDSIFYAINYDGICFSPADSVVLTTNQSPPPNGILRCVECTICAGDSADLRYTTPSFVEPYSIMLSDGTNNYSVLVTVADFYFSLGPLTSSVTMTVTEHELGDCSLFPGGLLVVDVTVNSPPNVGIVPTDTICASADYQMLLTPGSKSDGAWAIAPSGTIDMSTGLITASSIIAGQTYTVSYTADTLGCDTMVSEDIFVSFPPNAEIIDIDTACISGTYNMQLEAGSVLGGTWGISDGGTISSTGSVDEGSIVIGNTYVVSYQVGPMGCDTTVYDSLVFINQASVNLLPLDDQCAEGIYDIDPGPGSDVPGTWTINNGGVIDASTGEVDLAASGSGVYAVTYTAGISPCQDSATQTFEIFELPIAADHALEECDDGGNGMATFTLTDADAVISNGSGLPVIYHSTFSDADQSPGINPIGSAYTTSMSPDTVYGRIENANGCYDIGLLVLEVLPSPTLSIDSNVCAMDLSTYTIHFQVSNGTVSVSGGYTAVNTTGNNYEIAGVLSNTSVTITVSSDVNSCDTMLTTMPFMCACPVITAPVSLGDTSICEGSAIPSLEVTVEAGNEAHWFDMAAGGTDLFTGNSYTPSVSGAGVYTYYVEAEEISSGCTSATRTAVTLTITANPTASNAMLSECDDDADGFVQFTLTDAQTTILAGQTGMTVSYHLSQVDADGGQNPQASPFTNTVNPQTLYVRVEDGNGCFATSELTLMVDPLPTLQIDSLPCSADLTTYTIYFQATGGTPTVTGGYAVTNTSGNNYEIAGVAAGMNVTITVTNGTTMCDVDQAITAPDCMCPTITAPVSLGDTSICEGSAIPSLDVTVEAGNEAHWYDMATGGTDLFTGTSYTPSVSGVGVYTYYVEAEEISSGCMSATRTAVTLTITANPTAANAMLSECDDDTDGFVQFTLTDAQATILAGQTGMTVSYHLNQADADGGQNPQASPFTNTVNPQTLYVRVEDGNGCYATSELTLMVDPLPTLQIDSLPCSADLTTYTIYFQATGGTPTVTGGYTVTNPSGNNYEIVGVAAGMNVTITVTNGTTMCDVDQAITAPDCMCPTITAPVSLGDTSICDGAAIPSLEVTVEAGNEAHWYDMAAGGSDLFTGTTYTPSVSGVGVYTYYVEAEEISSGCTSATRTAVTLTITANPTAANAMLSECDDDTDGFAQFTLTDAQATILAGQTGMTVSYHLSQIDADASQNAQASPFTNTVNPQTLYVRVEDGNGCYATSELTLMVNPLPTLQIDSLPCSADLTTYTVYFQATGGTPTVTGGYTVTNPSGNNYEIIGVAAGMNVTITVTNGTTMCDVDQAITAPNCACPTITAPISLGDTSICEGSAIPSLEVTVEAGNEAHWYDMAAGGSDLFTGTSYAPSVSGVGVYTYYVEAEEISSGCTSATRTAVTLTITANPTAANAMLSECDDDTDGFAQFTLTDAQALILAGQTGMTVSYHLSQVDADASQNPQASPFTNTINPQTLYVRVEDGNGCYATSELTLTVDPLPTLQIDSLPCSSDLTTYTVYFQATGGTPAVTGGYTVTNPSGNNYEIVGVTAGMNVTVTVTNGTTMCDVDQVITAPACMCPTIMAPVSLGDTNICEGSAIPSLEVTVEAGNEAHWYDMASGGTDLFTGTSYTPSVSGVGVHTYYVEAEEISSGCTSATRTAVTLTITANPTAANAMLSECDDDTDGFAQFTLTDAQMTILGGQTGMTLSYHLNQVDADGGQNPQVSPFTNTVNPQTLYVRVEDGNGCYATSELTLMVDPLPTLQIDSLPCSADLTTYTIYFQATGGTPTVTGGYAVTNPSGNNYEIVGVTAGMNVTVTVTNGTTMCDVDQLITAPACMCPTITAPVSLGDTSICEGSAIPSLEVTVEAGNEAHWFDMAVGGTDLFTGTSYTPSVSGVGVYTYYVEAEAISSGCTSATRTAVTLTITANPTAANAMLSECDDDTDGFAQFTLTDAQTTILGGQTGMSLSYHLNQADADAGQNPQASPFTNTINPQTLYVRVEDGNGCYATSELTLMVDPLPTLQIDSLSCSADLTTYTVYFQSTGGTPTVTGGYAVTNPSGNNYEIVGVAGGMNVTITVTNGTTMCDVDQLIIAPACMCPAITAPASLGDTSICEGSAIPSLEVTVEAGNEAHWYDMAAGGTDLFTGTSYTPSVSGVGVYTYYVEAEAISSGCTSATRTAVTLTITANPTATNAMLSVCDDDTDGFAQFTLTDAEATILAGQTGMSLSYHLSQADADGGQNPQASPFTNTINPQTLYVRVEDGNGCYATSELTLMVDPLPTLQIDSLPCSADLTTYTIYFQSTGGTPTVTGGYTVTSTGGDNYEIIGIASGTNVTITVTNGTTTCEVVQPISAPNCACPTITAPISLGDTSICDGSAIPSLEVTVEAGNEAHWYDMATGGTDLFTGDSYTPSVSGVGVYTYYVEAEEISSGCMSATRTAVTLTITANPTATNAMLNECDDDTDGFVQFALTDARTTILAGQTGMTVSYHLSQVDADASQNPQASPFTNTINPQTLYVRVEDGNGCYATSELTLMVDPLPTIQIDSLPCSADLTTYTIYFQSAGGTPTVTGGYTVTNPSGNNYEIAGVASGMNVTITVINGTTMCEVVQLITAPACICPTIEAPTSLGDTSICAGAAIPALEVLVGPGMQARWYDVPVGGVILDTGSSYLPAVAGVGTYVYYVDAIELVSGCVSDMRTRIELEINPVPTADDVTLRICDENNDGFAPFDLALATSQVLNGQSGLIVTYHLSMMDAENDQNNLAIPFTNTINPQTIFARVEDGNNCFAISEITLIVDLLPTLNIDSLICSSDLTTYTIYFQASGGLVIPSDGYTAVNTGGDFYEISGIISGQSISIEVTNQTSNCSVNQLIQAPDCDCDFIAAPISLGDTSICEGAAIPNLEVVVGAGIDAVWFDVPTGGTELFTGNIFSPAVSSMTGSYSYFVEAVEMSSGCRSSVRTEVVLNINPVPLANDASISICDVGADDVELFSLEDANAEILNGQSGLVVSYFESMSDAETNVNNINSPYMNMSNPQTIYARVENGFGCFAISEIELSVDPLPLIEIDTTLCDANLSTYSVLIQASGGTVTASGGYTVVNVGPDQYEVSGINEGQNIFLTITNSLTMCSVQIEAISPQCDCPFAPVTNAGQDENICETDSVQLLGFIGGSATSVTWSTNGDGQFSDTTSLTPIYYPGVSDIANGLVTITIETNDPDGIGPCMPAVDVLNIIISPLQDPDLMNLGPYCDQDTVIQLNTNQNGIIGNWSGQGVSSNTFNPSLAGQGDWMLYFTPNTSFCASLDSVLIQVDSALCSDTCFITDMNLDNIDCNNANTSMDPLDDFITFTLNPQGQGQSLTYNVVSDAGLVVPSVANFGMETMFRLPNGTAGNGNVLITITDADNAMCSFDIVINDPGTCSSGCITDTTYDQSTSCNPLDTGIVSTLHVGSDGCDSVHIITTTLLLGDVVNLMDFTCDPMNVGIVRDTLVNQAGCDSIVVTDVQFDMNAVDTTYGQATSCSSLDTGVVATTMVGSDGCDSVHIVTTTLVRGDIVNLMDFTCDPMEVGIIRDTFANQAGCDSIVITDVQFDINAADTTYDQMTSCNPLDTGVVSTTTVGSDGCDSTHIVTTTLLTGDVVNLMDFTCDPMQVGIVRDTFPNQAGCDSIVITAVQFDINAADTTYDQLTSCNPLDTGVVATTTVGSDGCDSTHVITTSLSTGDVVNLMEETCDPTQVGIFRDTFPNQAGCDSIVIIDVQFDMDAADTTVVIEFTCLPADTGTVEELLMTSLGCDSLVITHTVLQAVASPTTFIQEVTCNSSSVGIDSITLVNAAGCDSLVVIETILGTFNLEVDPALSSISSGDSIALVLSSNVDLTLTDISWVPPTTLSCDTCISVTASPTTTTTYMATAVDEDGCIATVTAVVQVNEAMIYIPNVFSPNDDQINDVFTIYSDAGRDIGIRSFEVFNRWGGKVFERTKIDLDRFEGWNGFILGDEAKEDVYVYQIRVVIDGNEERLLKGEIHLVR